MPNISSVGSKSRVLQVSKFSEVMLKQVQEHQKQDPELLILMEYLEEKKLPDDLQEAKVIMNLARKGYFVVDNVRTVL